MPFDFISNERKWQQEWAKAGAFEANVQEGKPKFFITFPYPYLNGAMHIGHSYSFFRTDVYARYMRMKGFNVLFPQGFHATGEPIMGTVERLRSGDGAQLQTFKASGATDADIERFKQGPEHVAKFWMQRWIADLQAAGASIDWRRTFITTDLTPTYSRFIEWQYNSLRKKGFVVQGTHPVIWCPHDLSPTGDHDRYVGEGESPIEYAILKFRMQYKGEKLILPCATLRPETIYGVTNIWLNPEEKYVRAKVDGETWVLSDYAARKLSDQQHKVEVMAQISPAELMGQSCTNPALNNSVPVLPARFITGKVATGVVMSVPGHAPYDYAALEDLKKDGKQIAEYHLDGETLGKISPISLISLEGYGEFPASEECRKLGISSQLQKELLEKATSEIYKQEFHKGVVKEGFGALSGKAVSEAKELVVRELKRTGSASSIWESSGEVVCRCMTPCHVKILENQWFLKFSDQSWKEKVKGNLANMSVFPEEARLQMRNTVDWLQNKACARKSGLGTKLPWDKDWIVETLSDSTIYMAYYTIARILDEKRIQPKQLPDEAFDFIFTGNGEISQVMEKTTLAGDSILEMRREFEYFYPVDLRNSGKDLLQNHLLFYLFHHAAIFNSGHQPKGIAVNGYVTVEGEKMSKSKGNIAPIREMLSAHGADLVRINIAAAGEGMDDADWRIETIPTYRKLLEFLHETATKLQANEFQGKEFGRAEKLLESTLNSSLKAARGHMDLLRFRSAVHLIAFGALSALKAYVHSKNENSNSAPVRMALGSLALMLSPFTPHFSEELWRILGKSPPCSLARYPEADDAKINPILEQEEKYLRDVEEDIRKIIAYKKGRPKNIRLFAAPAWQTEALRFAIGSAASKGKYDLPALIKEAVLQERLKAHARLLPPLLQAIGKSVNYYKSAGAPGFGEYALLKENERELGLKFGCKLEVFPAEQVPAGMDPANRAGRALPLKPAIFLQE